MGCYNAQFLANLYLFQYEYQYVKDLDFVNSSSEGYFIVRFIFMDDNGINDFVNVANSIYDLSRFSNFIKIEHK